MVIVIAIILTVLTFVTGVYILNKEMDSDKFWKQILGTSIAILGAPIVCGIVLSLGGYLDNNPTPKAIDVYRGKTTLQITYQDSVPVDSIVVFKKK